MYVNKPYPITGEFGRRVILVKGAEKPFTEQKANICNYICSISSLQMEQFFQQLQSIT